MSRLKWRRCTTSRNGDGERHRALEAVYSGGSGDAVSYDGWVGVKNTAQDDLAKVQDWSLCNTPP